MSKIGPEQIEYLSHLARLGLSRKEADTLVLDIKRIIEFVDRLKKAPTGKLEPTAQVTGLSDVWREDEVKASEVPPDKLLESAPMTEGRYIKVKRVL